MRTTWICRLLFSIVFFLLGNAGAATIQLTQGGWESGGPLIVVFDAEDSNLDGQIDQSELSGFSANYALPQGGSTTWSTTDLQPNGFKFLSVGDYLLFATNPNYTLIDSGFEGEAHGSVIDSFLFPVDITEDLPTAVPEPAGLAYFGFAVIFAWRTRHYLVNRNVS